MMNVTTGEVRKLVEHRGSPCVSVYMTTDPVWPGGPADKVRLRNLLREAARRLARAHEPEEIEQLLVPVAERVRERWPPNGRGIALLRSPDVNVSFDLPVEVPDLAVVAPTFHTKPLVAYLDRNQHFFVLALADRSVRLLEGGAEGLVDVTAETIPARLAGGPPEPQKERYVGVHGSTAAGRAAERRGGKDAEHARKARRRRWFAELDAVVTARLRPSEAPLVLAGVREHQALYRTVSGYSRILEKGIEGNAERLPERELHARAWPLVCAEQAEIERAAATHWLSFRGAGMATDVLAEVIAAAGDGRVRLLLHREGAHLWGRMDAELGTFVLRAGEEDLEPGDSDLIDDLCELTLVKGGDVVEIAPERMPTEVPIAAILRY